MFSTLRTRFGIPGVISVIALVFALFGGAYAASNSSGGGKATASKSKAKKGPRGPKGATGPAGPAGPQGPAGPAGAKGDAGANGAAGGAGPTGPQGPQGPKGTNGTNGTPGATGPEGSPWTAGGTLPAEKTETGTWTAGPAREFQSPIVPISYPIPLAEASEEVVYLNAVETEASPGSGECEYEPEATPVAPPGTLCVFATAEEGFGEFRLIGLHPAEPGKDTPTGTYIWIKGGEEGEFPAMSGVWAVTARTATP
jgi:hypothetical protein